MHGKTHQRVVAEFCEMFPTTPNSCNSEKECNFGGAQKFQVTWQSYVAVEKPQGEADVTGEKGRCHVLSARRNTGGGPV